MDWLSGYFIYKSVPGIVTYAGTNFRDAENNIITVSGSGESNTASNQGVGGTGLFNGKVGVDLQFRNLIAGSSKTTVTLDAPDKEVVIDVVESALTLGNLGGSIDLGGAR